MPKKPTGVAYLGAILLLGIAVAPQLLFEANDPAADGTPYRIGRMLGAAVFSLLIGWLFWWIARKTRPKGTLPRFSPWVLVIAAGVALLSALPSLAQRNLTEAAEEFGSSYGGSAEDYLIEPAGFRYVELDAATQSRVESSISGDAQADAEIEDFAVRQVVKGDRPLGAVIVVLMAGPSELWEEGHAGFQRGFEESSNVDLEPTTVAGIDAASGTGAEGTFVTLFDRNLVIQVIGPDEATARAIAEAQAAAYD